MVRIDIEFETSSIAVKALPFMQSIDGRALDYNNHIFLDVSSVDKAKEIVSSFFDLIGKEPYFFVVIINKNKKEIFTCVHWKGFKEMEKYNNYSNEDDTYYIVYNSFFDEKWENKNGHWQEVELEEDDYDWLEEDDD